jgi:uncharacterized integral membrane protein
MAAQHLPHGSSDVDGSGDLAAQAVPPRPSGVPSTRAGRLWLKAVPAAILLAVLLVFVFDNLRSTKVTFFTASGRLPLAVALLAAAGIGGLCVFALGSVRILQLRRTIRSHRRER